MKHKNAANLERAKAMLEIRRSNAAVPIPSKKKYKRKPKYPQREDS